ncbi:Uncharacterised protein [Amycolatopsis camponoti]|uniref:Uncharacterized protein n=1 Tax=Amycolatopsis camponoti TaxID=2606593 RepID=A0A6I8M4L1_9PSEU|nr:hypothetical protein [Amycolatopsis camponoti]VVJ23699.1 Uncharacterised protein [Amycolatopsis camponoti]
MRKRLVIAGTAVAACGALAVSGVLTSANAAPATPVAPAALAAAPVPPARAAAPEHEVLGDVIPSGIGDLVFYGVKLRESRLPQTTFGIMAGVRDASGLKDLVVANETSGSDKAPGFHSVTGGMNADGHDVPGFGYYVGPAAKITSSVGVAHQARWSADPNVVVFWFDLGTPDPARLKAYDAAGNKLPGGTTDVGHG